jgi:hypothetical protein
MREGCPGFHAMEKELLHWLKQTFGVDAELDRAHALRQSMRLMAATGFDWHQDTDDNPLTRCM